MSTTSTGRLRAKARIGGQSRLIQFLAVVTAAAGTAFMCASEDSNIGSSGGPPPSIVFGLGPTANVARDSQLNQDAPLGMYTTWFNGTSDLTWMSTWENTVVPQTYASGRAMHLITFSDRTPSNPESGDPCGRPYPISHQVLVDMERLAEIFGGEADDPPLYVTLFTEFQTYPCQDNQWVGAEGYYALLQAKMIEIRDIFHEVAPNSRVSIGWGGWQARWNAPGVGGGRALFPYFAGVNSQMDFQSFQAMHYDLNQPTIAPNLADVQAMTEELGQYGPVMVAHHKPDGFHAPAFDLDIQAIFNDQALGELAADGLFAWSFMDQAEMNASPTIYGHVRDAVLRYSATGCEGPECDLDTDGDGCTDGQELGQYRAFGGQRDPEYFWDFFDTPDAIGVRNRAIAIDDLARVVGRFGSSRTSPQSKADALQEALTVPPAAPAYHPAYDRHSVAGKLSGSPNGAITVNDILLLVTQFGNSCA